VVRPEEGVEAVLLGGAGHAEQLLVRRPLLRLGEDPEVHDRTLGAVPEAGAGDVSGRRVRCVDDKELLDRIAELVKGEHELETRHGADGLSEEEQARLAATEVALDQCWDLLRQRRARRASGRTRTAPTSAASASSRATSSRPFAPPAGGGMEGPMASAPHPRSHAGTP
jgi:hypothetical protein